MKTRLLLLTLVGLAFASPQRSVRFAQNPNVGVPLPSLSTSVQSSAPAPKRGNESPIAAVRAGSDTEGKGLPVNQPSQGQSSSLGTQHFTVRRESAEDFASREVDDQPRFRSPFTRFLSDEDDQDDVLSRERFDDDDDMIARISLGRRFHPHGVPISRAPSPSLANQPQQRSEQILNPHIHSPDIARLIFDDSGEIDDDDDEIIFVNLSPSVRAFNHETDDERLSLTNSILNQYNFVDTQGTINWGYRTNDQYQEHKVNNDGTMAGSFGWTAPEGSEVSIKYIADEGGYQVISSTGTYLRESADVLAERERHFQEHARARARLNPNKEALDSFDAIGSSGASGVPLPSLTPDTREPTGRIDSPAGFVVIEDEDDFPLLAGGRLDGGVPLPNFGSSDSTRRTNQDNLGVPLPSLDLANLAREEGLDIGGVHLPSIGESNQADRSQQGHQGNFGVPLPALGNTNGNVQGDSGVPLPDFRSISLQSPSSQGSSNAFGVPLPDIAVSDQGSNGGVSLSSAVNLNEGTARQSPTPTNFGVPLPDISTTIESGAGGVPLSSISGRTEGSAGQTPTQGSFGIPRLDASIPGTLESGGVPLSTISGRNEGSPRQTVSQGSFGVALPDGSSTGITGTGGVPLSTISGRSEGQTVTQTGTIGVPLPDRPSSPERGQDDIVIPVIFGLDQVSNTHGSFGIPLASAIDTGIGGQSRGVALSPSDQPQGTFGVHLPENTNIGSPTSNVQPEFPIHKFPLNTGIPLPMLKTKANDESLASLTTSQLSRESIGVALPARDVVLGTKFNEPASTGEQLPPVESSDLGFDSFSVGVPMPVEEKTGRSETELPVLEQSVDSPASGSGVGLPSINIKDPSLGIIGESISIEPKSDIGVDLPSSPLQSDISASQPSNPVLSSGVSLPQIPKTSIKSTKDSVLLRQGGQTSFGVPLPKDHSKTESEVLPPAQTVHEKPDITIVKLPDSPNQGVSILKIPADQPPKNAGTPGQIGVPLSERKQISNTDTGSQSGVSLPEQPVFNNIAEGSGFGVKLPKQKIIKESQTSSIKENITPSQTADIQKPDFGVLLPSGRDTKVQSDSTLPKQPSLKSSIGQETGFGVKLPKPLISLEHVHPNLEDSPPGLPAFTKPVSKPVKETLKKVRTKITPISSNFGVALPDFPSEKMKAPSSTIFSETNSRSAPVSAGSGINLSSFPTESNNREVNHQQSSIPSRVGVGLPNFPSERITAPTSTVIGRSGNQKIPTSSGFGVSLPNFPIEDTKASRASVDSPPPSSSRIGVSLPSFPSERITAPSSLSTDQDTSPNLISSGKSLGSNTQNVGIKLPVSNQAQDQTAAASEVQSQILKGIFDELVKLSSSRRELPLP